MWQVIAQGDSVETFRVATPTVYEVPAGSQVLIRIELDPWAPFGKLADMAGSEWWAQQLYSEVEVTDVYGNWHWMEIRGIAKGMGPVAVVIIVVAALVLLGLTGWIIRDIRLSADIREREIAKAQYMETAIRAGYTPAEAAEAWEKAELAPTPGVEMPSWVPAGIGFGTLALLALGAFLLLKK